MTDFLSSSKLENKKTHRKLQKFQENHYLCIQQAFCNIPAEMSYHSAHLYLIADIPQKGLKRGGTTRICKAMKSNDLHLSLHSVYLSKQRLYRLLEWVTDNQWCKYAVSVSDGATLKTARSSLGRFSLDNMESVTLYNGRNENVAVEFPPTGTFAPDGKYDLQRFDPQGIFGRRGNSRTDANHRGPTPLVSIQDRLRGQRGQWPTVYPVGITRRHAGKAQSAITGNTGDFFRKIVVLDGNSNTWTDEDGVMYVGVIPFLLEDIVAEAIG